MKVHYDLMENTIDDDLIDCETCGAPMKEAMTVDYESRTVEHTYENCAKIGFVTLTFEETLAVLEEFSWIPDEPRNTLIADLKEKM